MRNECVFVRVLQPVCVCVYIEGEGGGGYPTHIFRILINSCFGENCKWTILFTDFVFLFSPS